MESFMLKSKFIQPFITSIIGLIPNCASSVVITETYLGGGIAFGSCVAGLCANAGMGFVILLKNVKAWKRNLALIGCVYAISVLVGLVCNALPFL
jgi:peptidoglycan biosynthesis protein MviN/MurJ (putative lipid II flippase)